MATELVVRMMPICPRSARERCSRRPGETGDDDRERDSPQDPARRPGDDPFAALFGGAGPQDLGGLFQQLGRFLSYEGGPVNWDLAHDMARQTVVARHDRSVTDGERRRYDAVRLAELWLDDATALSTSAEADAWSRAEWVEAICPCGDNSAIRSPRAVSAMGEAVPAEMRQLGPLLGVMRQMARCSVPRWDRPSVSFPRSEGLGRYRRRPPPVDRRCFLPQ